MTLPGKAVLQIDDLHAYYGPAHILQGVSLTVGADPVAVIGRNGMGKTTLCHVDCRANLRALPEPVQAT
jgi:branched-chain amino acid transport system ATP-binding protein